MPACSSGSSPSATSRTDPTTGHDAHRARADPADGRDRAQGRGGRPRRVRHRRAPQPAVRAVVADHDAGLHRGEDRAPDPVDRDDADHDQRPGEDRRGLRDAPAPRRRPGRPDDGPRQHGPGLPVVRPGHPQRHRARLRELRPAPPPVARGRRRLGGQVPDAADRVHARPRARSTACRRSCGTARSAARRSPSRPPTTATASSTTTSSGRRSTSSGWSTSTAGGSSTTATGRPTRRSSGSAARCSCAPNSQDGDPRVPAVLRPRAGLRRRAVARGLHGPDAADRRQPAAGHRPDAGVPRDRRRLPAPAVPRRPRRACRCEAVLEQLEMLGDARRARCCAGSSRRASPRTCPTRRRTRASRPRATPRRPAPRRRRRRAPAPDADAARRRREPVDVA